MPSQIRDPLGRGIKFPFQIGANGGIARSASTTEDEQMALLNSSITQILGTDVGERFGNRGFGSRLFKIVFDTANVIFTPAFTRYVLQSITRWEPRVTVLGTRIITDNIAAGQIGVQLRLRVNQTNREGTAVSFVPFSGPKVPGI